MIRKPNCFVLFLSSSASMQSPWPRIQSTICNLKSSITNPKFFFVPFVLRFNTVGHRLECGSILNNKPPPKCSSPEYLQTADGLHVLAKFVHPPRPISGRRQYSRLDFDLHKSSSRQMRHRSIRLPE